MFTKVKISIIENLGEKFEKVKLISKKGVKKYRQAIILLVLPNKVWDYQFIDTFPRKKNELMSTFMSGHTWTKIEFYNFIC